MQIKPSSNWQSDEHPSPGRIFPSSHFSDPFINESPQRGEQSEPNPMHLKPYSFLQVDEHPSPLMSFESSHYSFES